MEFEEYANRARETADYPERLKSPLYPALALAGEAGELVNWVKKWWRKTGEIRIAEAEFIPTGQMIEKVVEEMGDSLWYLAMLADELGVTLTEVAERNLDKLSARKEKGTIANYHHE